MNGMKCPTCESRDVVTINLTLERRDQVSFYSCHRCDKRWWFKDGESVALGSVLDMARKTTKIAS
ncbi:MAG: hypothetical protein NVSMB57_07360 [Actinomycetota bacterium]